ncbi:response regulator transcription factor [Marinomonas mediterranea]|jgi:Response regulators consisting of a CheY-like receiver domain and a winged-helix DNA-binding domain|uniref:Two component transcriptional regulator, winged helix family n=1 Tax=Marinomonas mediterranea (strain ATCC 700492 / JCM 21426 / NBRC 103028 / MMB-1) TaxID=717774 RepID=F2JYP4_MARM1|nr:response regulator transcription factor [Marinomonas mediterranea]ADZ89669.1 two component transcriptional regulator, winged helix family [Marinomonas mediterranea MMB-1]WCN07762.1 response regulator [Marinomonas mediterranea]WCN11862.1 response regulator [Marinomonas mediterranea]WCN15907.1 response regulator [Marinomonas mediterranea MMB-1]
MKKVLIVAITVFALSITNATTAWANQPAADKQVNVAEPTITIVEAKEIRDWLCESLTKVGHVVDAFDKGREALIAASTRDYHVLILDWMVPDLDGIAVLKTLRAAKINTSIMMLTALGDVDDRVTGLEAGADDYLAKPFAISELLARINALGRRTLSTSMEQQQDTTLVYEDLELDLLALKCHRADENILLNTKEIRLLETLMRNQGRVMTRSMLLERVWNIDFNPETSIVETHISRLRAKVDKPFPTSLIRTVRGAGYIFGN